MVERGRALKIRARFDNFSEITPSKVQGIPTQRLEKVHILVNSDREISIVWELSNVTPLYAGRQDQRRPIGYLGRQSFCRRKGWDLVVLVWKASSATLSEPGSLLRLRFHVESAQAISTHKIELRIQHEVSLL